MKTTRNKDSFIKDKDKNVFIMMRYRDTNQFSAIEDIIASSLEKYGLHASFAKDTAYKDDLWDNITFYMDNSDFGIVVFEEIDEREFNPNVSLELGYMYAKRSKCLLLKDRRMPKLPTDVCGKIYRDFDTYNLSSIQNQIENWCEKDLLLERKEKIIYDSKSLDNEFNGFWAFGMRGLINQQFKKVIDTSNELCVKIESVNNEPLGANLIIENCLEGIAKFKYKAIESSTKSTNLYFCMIPMIGIVDEIIEYSADEHLDPANGSSPYRERFYVSDSNIADKEWHEGIIKFNFSHLSSVTYCIFGVRIYVGCPRKGKGQLLTKDIKIIAS